uniref:Uncharacterized protein n=1 Tax=Anguilla anguilla TaxID=7936 RepID=A0A0E9TJD6_ANGAN
MWGNTAYVPDKL